MPSTKIIQDPEAFHLPSKWEALPQNPRVVDQNGNSIGTSYVGHRFNVLCDAKLSRTVYKLRWIQAILMIIFTLGIVYRCCSERIKSLLTQKHRLYITPREVTLEDAETELKNGM